MGSIERLLELKKEDDARAREGVRIYRPSEQQNPIHLSLAPEILVRGGKRCIAGDSVVYDPMSGLSLRIDQIKRPFHVESLRPHDGAKVIASAEVPFTKGYDEFFRVSLSNGNSFTATRNHLVLTCSGWSDVGRLIDSWKRHERIHLVSSLGNTHGGFARDAFHLNQIAQGCLDDYCQLIHQCDELLPSIAVCGQFSPPSQADAHVYNHWNYCLGDRGDKAKRNHSCQSFFRPSILCAGSQTSDRVVSSGTHFALQLYSLPWKTAREGRQFPATSFHLAHTKRASVQLASQFSSQALTRRFSQCDGQQYSQSTLELQQCSCSHVQVDIVQAFYQRQTCSCDQSSKGAIEAPIVTSVVSVGKQLVWDFEVPETGNYMMAGVVHHNSGKSVSVACEFSHRVTGLPLYDCWGNEIPQHWPQPKPDYPRIYWIIGWDTSHIGQTIHKLLFQPGMGGQFRCIRDLVTGKWRPYNRANAEDRKRIKESMLTEPLIPERLIESWEWENKQANEFSGVRLKNGASIFAYPSSARAPKQGDAVSGIWIDEDIQFPGHLREWQDRLTDEEGWFLWSVWPHMKNEALLGLLDRAEIDEYSDNPQIQAFQLEMTANPYLTDKGKEQSLGRMGSEEEIARRNRGELLIDTLSMYSFDSNVHGLKRPAADRRPRERSAAYKFLLDLWMATNTFPRDWTRYLTIDPSHTRTACHSWVVPPREVDGVFLGDVAIAEWEFIGRKYSAKMLAQNLVNLMGSNPYEAFIMDMQMGRQTHAGRERGDNACNVYSSAFRDQGLYSRLSSYSFLAGCNVPQTRYRAVRDLLVVQPTVEIPSLMFVEERCPETKKEFGKYRKKTENRGEGMDSVLDEPANPRLFDAMASTEYFAAFIQQAFVSSTAFVDPSNYHSKGSPAYQRAQLIKKAKEETNGVVYLGPGSYDQ